MINEITIGILIILGLSILTLYIIFAAIFFIYFK